MNQPLSVLIVDDEKMPRETLAGFIPWQELGVHKIFQAEDGASALDLAVEHQPDIIISDIKMPRMNGVQLAAEIRLKLPDCKFVFLSGYSDKEYLKSAIKLKAASFIEKPIDIDEISELVSALVKECRRERKEQLGKKAFTEQELVKALWQSEISSELMEKLTLQKTAFVNPERSFTAVIIKPLCDSFMIKEYSDLILQVFADYRDAILLDISHQVGMLMICALNEDFSFIKLKALLHAYITKVQEQYPASHFFISLGSIEDSINGINNACINAQKTLKECFYYEYNYVNPTSPSQKESFYEHKAFLLKYSEALKSGKVSEAEAVLNSLVQELRIRKATDPEYVKNIFYQASILLVKQADTHNVAIYPAGNDKLLHELTLQNTLSGLARQMLLSTRQFFDETAKKDILNLNPLARLTTYILEYYSDEELSIESLSKALSFTPNYLCNLFKKETGKTINQYITELRIQKSRELLTETNHKLCDISRKVGYVDAKYFTKLFTKTVGIGPRQYRERQKSR